MTEQVIEVVGVAGAGTMGAGIAQATALGGYEVILYDLSDDILEKAVDHIRASIDKGVQLGKVQSDVAQHAHDAFRRTTRLSELASADLVIEAVPENLELKQDLFAKLDALAPPQTILASNTSSLSINALAGATDRPYKFLGLHFFNPAHIMKLVEVIRAEDTSEETMSAATAYVERLGKSPVFCKDTPGFIVNRVARPFYGEAFRLLGEDATGIEEIDGLMESIGFRMGPFRLVDLIGCDVNFAVSQTVYEAYFHDPKYRPHPLQRRMVQSGRLGRKSGRGFYNYGEGSGEA
ncbi:MAG TPA: 3-hydroxyacyl-CoA dehydrogenase NAD-binding domain-containing protein [Candidatus Sulfomarinibacteraceae bacterium]|nr:3-hydroxyacyl-CoA dehydrogenase NAD-binding domain-containing protein [Candidatus Sulfomarinibacteraceae bacterium]